MTLVALIPAAVVARAYGLVLEHRLRTLDAIHIAVALDEDAALATGDELVFVTRDTEQAAAAAAVGLAVR